VIDDLTNIKAIIKDFMNNEKLRSILEISGYDESIAKLFSNVKIDRVDLTDCGNFNKDSRYRKVYNSDCFKNINEIEEYDAVLIFHLFENIPADYAKEILIDLLTKVKKSILLFTPMYPYDLESETEVTSVRVYHPIFFIGLEFSYNEIDNLQVYNFFPTMNYKSLICDKLVNLDEKVEKMNIAYILPSQAMTGGVKALLQQIKELHTNGHIVNLYYRCDKSKRAIPEWSHLTDNDVSTQLVIPENKKFIDYLNEEDIVVLGFVNEVNEFQDSKIPVVLWEQGSPAIYGDFNDMIYSTTPIRLIMHTLYRIPVHMMAVSKTIQDILKGIYNRESQIFPNGIDTDFYYPLESKNNDIPIVLLVGNPSLKFKGFDFALSVLKETAKMDIPFKVWWVSQVECSVGNASFDIEYFILPSQEKLAELYRNADIYLSTSLYESFPLPPIEAMASGTAVLSTDNGGINTYAKPGENCLLCEQGDLPSMSYALTSLLLNPQARESLAKAGRETALEYTFKNITPILERCLYNIISNKSQC